MNKQNVTEQKKPTPVLLIAGLIVVALIICLPVSIIGGYLVTRGSSDKSIRNNTDTTIEDTSPSSTNNDSKSNQYNDKEARFKEIQAEILEVQRQAMTGEISQEEAQKRLTELQMESNKLLLE